MRRPARSVHRALRGGATSTSRDGRPPRNRRSRLALAVALAALASVLGASSAMALNGSYRFTAALYGSPFFAGPGGVDVDSAGNVYVMDVFKPSVQRFTATGQFLNEWGSSGTGAGQFSGSAWTLAVDSSANVYVADASNNRIQKFTSTGTFVAAWGWGVSTGTAQYEICTASCRAGIVGSGQGQFSTPYGIATDTSNNVYVSDSFNNRIQKFNSSGTFLTRWGSSGTGAGQFSSAEGLSVSSSGSVYLADTHASRIQRFTNTGAFVSMWGWGVSTGANQYEICTANCRPGIGGTGSGQLSYPVDTVEGPGGDIVASDYGAGRLVRYTATGTPVAGIGSFGSGDGQYSQPTGLAYKSGASGGLYIGDNGNDRVQKLNDSNAFVQKWGVAGTARSAFSAANGVAFNSSSNTLYVADTNNNRMLRYDGAGTFLGTWGTAGTASGQIQLPRGVAISSTGDVYVVDSGNSRIAQFTSTGAVVRYWGWGVLTGASQLETCTTSCRVGIAGSGNGQFNLPLGIALDSSGNVYVVDRNNSRVQKFTSTGTFVTRWGSNGSGDGQFSNPFGIAVDSSGNVYVGDTSNNRIQKFNSSGTFLARWGTFGSADGQLANPLGVAVNSSGEVLVTDTSNNRIQKFSSTGTFITKWGGFGSGDGLFNSPVNLALTTSGHVYVVETTGNRVQRFDWSASNSSLSNLLTDYAGNRLRAGVTVQNVDGGF